MTSETRHLVCPQCLTTNRVPADRLRDGPVCGKCKQTLVPDHPLELNDQNFSGLIARTDLPVVVDFWAPWCPPCKMMGPHFQRAAGQLQGEVILGKLDTEAHPSPAAPLNIAGIPTMILFQSGREAARTSGAMETDDIVAWIRGAIR